MSNQDTSHPSSDSSRNEQLLRELQQLQQINSVVANVNHMLHHTKANINTLNESTGITQHLLDKWVRILNQTNYNQQLIQEMNQQKVLDEELGVDSDEETDIDEKLQREKELIAQIEALKQKDEAIKDRIKRKEEGEEGDRKRHLPSGVKDKRIK